MPTSADRQPRIEPSEDNIIAAVARLGLLGGETPRLEGYSSGGQCRVYKLGFSPQRANRNVDSLAVRIPVYMNGSDDIVIQLLGGEWQTLRALEVKGFAWSPKPLGCSLSYDNLIGLPFLVLSWVDGSPTVWTDEVPARPVRDKFLSQLARFHGCLVECTLENNENATWEEFFLRVINNKRPRIVNGSLPNLGLKDCDDQEALLSLIININDQRGQLDSREFAMDHGDIKPDNIIVDDDYNITGVIDWGFAASVPIPRAAALPRFLWEHPAPSPSRRKDKQSYLAAITSQFPPEAPIRIWHTQGDVDFRAHYLESIFSKGMHAIMARNGWRIPAIAEDEGEVVWK